MSFGVKDFSHNAIEAAARMMKGIPGLHREGSVLFVEDFEGTTPLSHWSLNPSVGGSVAIDGTISHSGAASCKFVVAAGGGLQTEILKAFPATPDVLGIRTMFRPTAANAASAYDLYLALNVWSGLAGIPSRYGYLKFSRLTNGTKTLAVANGINPDAFLENPLIMGFVADIFTDVWHDLKVTLNPATGQMVKGYLDGKTYDLSPYPMKATSGINTSGMIVQPDIYLVNRAAFAESLWLDDIVVTIEA